MRKSRGVVLLAAAFALLAGQAAAQSRANAGFERMKTLVGEWEGTYEGKPTRASYKLVSNGTALMETLETGDEEMITVYHADDDELRMTHYCGANNQPRMRAEAGAADSKTIRFRYVDVTNLASPDAGHMRGLEITFLDSDHITQVWTWREKGQDLAGAPFRFTRKK